MPLVVFILGIQAICNFKNSPEKVIDHIIASVARSAVLNGSDDLGNTPLHLAAWNECKHTFEWLIEERANPVGATRDNRQCTFWDE